MFEKINKPKEDIRPNENVDMSDMHDAKLHDQDETTAGGYKMDLATGEPIDNSHDDPLDLMERHTVKPNKKTEDALPPIIRIKEDEAEKWLRENDPEYKPSESVIYLKKKK